MNILKLKANKKSYVWGGNRLAAEFNKSEDKNEKIAESWELSCHKDGLSYIENGEFKNKTLEEYIKIKGKQVLGKNCEKFQFFPILIKLIDAKKNLSLQVHPSDEYALKNEGQYGKTEMWYIIDAANDAYLYYGFRSDISKEELKKSIDEKTILDLLNKVYVKKGDILFIESGTVHAIGKNILLAEIQQNSNITYRLYDFKNDDGSVRLDSNGKPRALHIKQALEVVNRNKISNDSSKSFYPHIAKCKYFTVDVIKLDNNLFNSIKGNIDEYSFLHILVLDGKGNLKLNDEKISYKKGDSFFIPAGSGAYELEGEGEILFTRV